MWKEWKKGFQLMKYSYNFKANIGMGIFFMVIGFIMVLIGPNSFLFGAVYFYLGTIMVLQLSYSLLFSQMVVASPKKRFIDIDFADFLSDVGAIFSYLLFCMFAVIKKYVFSGDINEYSSLLPVLGISILVCMIYYSVCYKYFVVGSVIFALVFATLLFASMSIVRKMTFGSLPVNIIIGLVIIVIGCLISGIVRKCYYRKPISTLAMGAALRKVMK